MEPVTFVKPVIEYAELSPLLIVFAVALLGVVVEAFLPRERRHALCALEQHARAHRALQRASNHPHCSHLRAARAGHGKRPSHLLVRDAPPPAPPHGRKGIGGGVAQAGKARAHEEAERRAAVDGLHSQMTKLAEAHSSHMADTDAAARGAAESLEAVRDEMKRSFGESAARLGSVERAGQHATEQLRAAFAEAQAAREAEVVELTEAQAATAQKLSDELRWVDEEHMRCRAEDDQKVSAALEAVREETRGALEELRAQVSEAIVPLGEPGALSTLQQALLRVDTLGEAVAQLCAYMQSLKIKEVASAAEARLAELERRLTGGGTMVPAALDHRISQLEIALHEEQQSTLRALQAIVESQQAPH